MNLKIHMQMDQKDKIDIKKDKGPNC